MVGCLVGWLLACLVGWLVGWWLLGGLVGCLLGWLAGWLVGGPSPQDYLIALLMASPADVEWLVQERGICSQNRALRSPLTPAPHLKLGSGDFW